MGSLIAYQPYRQISIAEASELLLAALQSSFFILNQVTIQCILSPKIGPLAQAYQVLSLPGSILDPTVHLTRMQFYAYCAAKAAPVKPAAVGVWLRADGSILLTQTVTYPITNASWQLPGGKQAPGELPVQALIRELQEELAVTVLPADLTPLLFATDDQGIPSVYFYLLQLERQQPQAQEQQPLVWVLPEQITHYPMQVAHASAFYSLAYLLGRYSPHWSAYTQYLGLDRYTP